MLDMTQNGLSQSSSSGSSGGVLRQIRSSPASPRRARPLPAAELLSGSADARGAATAADDVPPPPLAARRGPSRSSEFSLT
ncbi:hypothetical protein NL676_033931 [Syzygium grande]|nr:hypothetical protein NL676_033931 [Syzygium grande]